MLFTMLFIIFTVAITFCLVEFFGRVTGEPGKRESKQLQHSVEDSRARTESFDPFEDETDDITDPVNKAYIGNIFHHHDEWH
jgi:hypothetical protein